MKLIPAPPHNSSLRWEDRAARTRRNVRLLGWDEAGCEITCDKNEEVLTHEIVPALPGYFALCSWLNDKEDGIEFSKHPVLAWRVEFSSYYGKNTTHLSTFALPICVAMDTSEIESVPILDPDGFVYLYDREPCPFTEWPARQFADYLEERKRQEAREARDKIRQDQLRKLKGCTDPIIFLQVVLALEGRPTAARILSKLTPARKSARDITPEQHEPIIAACQKTLGIIV